MSLVEVVVVATFSPFSSLFVDLLISCEETTDACG